MTISLSRQRLCEHALDNIDRLPDESARVVEYAIEQLVEGATPRYHEGGERPDRSESDQRMFVSVIRERFNRAGVDLDGER